MTAQHGIVRNSLLALAVQLTTASFTAVLTLYLVRALGPREFGIFALALAFSGLVTLPSDFGVAAAAARYIAERRGNAAAVAAVFVDALRLKLVLAGGVSCALALGSGTIAELYGDPALTWPLRGVALALFGQSLMLLLSGSFVAQARIDQNLLLVATESLIEVTASIALVAMGTGAAGAAFGRGVGYALGAAVGLALTLRLLGRAAVALTARSSATRALVGYARSLAIVDWAYAFFDQIDALLIGAFLGPAAVGLFQAPLRFVAFLFYPGYALASGTAPRLARGEGTEPNIRAFSQALRLSMLLQGALTAFVLGWAGAAVDLLLGDEYEESGRVLRALAPYVFFAGFGVLVSLGANYLGEARRRVPLALAALAINLAIDVVFIPRIGIVAGAIGTDIGYGVYVIGHLWICLTTLRLPLRPVALTALRVLAGTFVASALLFTLEGSAAELGPGLIGAPAALLVYVAILTGTGEIKTTELAGAWRLLRRRVARRS